MNLVYHVIIAQIITVNISIVIILIFIFSYACTIDLQDRVVVTGGWVNDAIATVQVYTLSGPQEQLPDLQTPRLDHACAHYLDSQDRAVSIIVCEADL